METTLQKTSDNNAMIESLVLRGDLSGLTPREKVSYYKLFCSQVGVDPATQPFKILKLNGKEVLYCDRSGAQQLNKLHKISHEKISEKEMNDVFIVYMRAKMDNGRFTDSSGAVNIAGLKGDALANAIMKAETKAKRRGTLDLVGLGMLDETELETIPNTAKADFHTSEILENKTTEIQDANFAEFNPATEIMNFGKKYNGMLWVEVPDDYLLWLASQSGKNATKAKKTLEYKKSIAEQTPNPLDTMFPTFEELAEKLQELIQSGTDINNIDAWKSEHGKQILSLSKKEQEKLKNIYMQYKSSLENLK